MNGTGDSSRAPKMVPMDIEGARYNCCSLIQFCGTLQMININMRARRIKRQCTAQLLRRYGHGWFTSPRARCLRARLIKTRSCAVTARLAQGKCKEHMKNVGNVLHHTTQKEGPARVLYLVAAGHLGAPPLDVQTADEAKFLGNPSLC